MNRCKVLFFLVVALSCSKGDVLPPQQHSPQEPESYIPIEAMVFELNGERIRTDSKDTVLLQEEGVRNLKFIGFEPSNATDISGARVDSVNFYHDLYTLNYREDSILIKNDAKSAAADDYYLYFLSGSFGQFCALTPQEGAEISFYNYVNRNADFATLQGDSASRRVHWEDFGKYRLYRLEFSVMAAEGKKVQRFSLPFYERRNKVKILAEGVAQDGTPCIQIAPGDTLQLEFSGDMPEEFTIYEWCKGVATERFGQLNRFNVEGAWSLQMEDTLLTGAGMRYTDSKIHLTPDGTLTLDKRWCKEGAATSGGGICTTIPISLILMPQGDMQVEGMKRTFTFPNGHTMETSPQPVYCNGVVEIIYD